MRSNATPPAYNTQLHQPLGFTYSPRHSAVGSQAGTVHTCPTSSLHSAVGSQADTVRTCPTSSLVFSTTAFSWCDTTQLSNVAMHQLALSPCGWSGSLVRYYGLTLV